MTTPENVFFYTVIESPIAPMTLISAGFNLCTEVGTGLLGALGVQVNFCKASFKGTISSLQFT
jgi:hypothetical protein